MKCPICGAKGIIEDHLPLYDRVGAVRKKGHKTLWCCSRCEHLYTHNGSVREQQPDVVDMIENGFEIDDETHRLPDNRIL